MWVQSLGLEDHLKEGMATHSSILAWRVPWTEEPGELQSMGSQKVGHNLATKQQQVVAAVTTQRYTSKCFMCKNTLMFIQNFLNTCKCLSVTACMHAKSFQKCPTLCNPMDCSPPGSSVHGILQARILMWVIMPSSRGSSPPRD